MQAIKLDATERLERNKAHRHSLRNKGFVPAVVYGKSVNSKAVAVSANELQRILADAGANALIHLNIKGAGPTESHQVLVKSVQREPLHGNLIHVDFHQVSSEDKVTATVPLNTIGTAPGVAKGGILAQQLHAIEVECQAANIPEEIKVDISNLEIGQAITLEELVLPDGVKALGEPNAHVLSIITARAEEEATEEETVSEEVEEVIS